MVSPGEPIKDPIDSAIAMERNRCLHILEFHAEDLKRCGLFERLWNLIDSGRDVADPSDQADRLPGF